MVIGCPTGYAQTQSTKAIFYDTDTQTGLLAFSLHLRVSTNMRIQRSFELRLASLSQNTQVTALLLALHIELASGRQYGRLLVQTRLFPRQL
jgi:uncharacterized membrane-anchored protein